MPGCMTPHRSASTRLPSVRPTSQPAGAALSLAGDKAPVMYRELLAVDLPTVLRVARAENLEIRQARTRVEFSRGQYESSFGALFPVIAPQVAFDHTQGTVRAVNGPLLPADFSSWAPAALIQWVINPGKVYYDIVASKKRLAASEHLEQQTIQQSLRTAANQYYDLVLAQAHVAVAQHSVAEAQELVRITRSRRAAGAGLEADALRAEANLSRRQQDLAIAIGEFYEASVALSLTLHLDATITLVPLPEQIPQVTLVRDDLTIDQMLALAVKWRQDLKAIRKLVAAAGADIGSTAWGGLGPNIGASYSVGGISSDTSTENFSLKEQRRFAAGAGFTIGLGTFGQIKTARASEKQASISAERQLDAVRAEVIRSMQAGATQAKLVPMAAQEVKAAESALNVAQANLRAGTMLTLDVLQAEDAVDEARLRYANAVVRYNQAQINLLTAMGLIDESALVVTVSATTQPSTQPSTSASR
jgi:outer membrane protein TolC